MKVYNERRYLNDGDLTPFDENKARLDAEKDYELNVYKTLISDYNDFIEQVAYLIKELDVCDNPTLKTIIINRLIKEGVFSIDNFSYRKNPFIDLVSNNGINVILGKGNDKSLTFFHKDIFDKLGEEFALYFCRLNRFTLNPYNPQNKKINHVISVIKPGDNIIGYDMTYDKFLIPKNGYQMVPIKGDGSNFIVTYKPYGEYITLGKDISELRKSVKFYNESSRKDNISLGKIVDMDIMSGDILLENEKELIRFNRETKVLKKDICKQSKVSHKRYI